MCGLVVGDRVIDVSREWRTFSDDTGRSDPSRVGGPENLLLNGSDLTTIIGKRNSSSGYFGAYGGIKYQNRRSMSSSDRALIRASQDISNMAEKINLPRTISDLASRIFKLVYEAKKLKKRSYHVIASACLYIACRQEGVPRTFKEICAVSNANKKEIGRCYRLILEVSDVHVNFISSGDFMFRFCSNLRLPISVKTTASHIAEKAVKLDIVPGRSPISVAAAAIFMASQASDDKRSEKEIGEVAGVADVTIRQAYRLMYPHVKQLFPDDFRFPEYIKKLPRV